MHVQKIIFYTHDHDLASLDPTIQLFLLLFTITRYYRGKMVLEVILISGRLDINYQLNTLETQCS